MKIIFMAHSIERQMVNLVLDALKKEEINKVLLVAFKMNLKLMFHFSKNWRNKMKVFVVYCHPSRESFTYKVKESFIAGLRDAGHEFVVSDLYADGFNPVMSEIEYLREGYYREELAVPEDMATMQREKKEWPVLWQRLMKRQKTLQKPCDSPIWLKVEISEKMV